LNVTNYYGPYFVKPNGNGKGKTWDDAISLPILLDQLNQGQRQNQVTIYVSEGKYKPTNSIDRNRSFLLNNIRIVGGFAVTSMGIDTTQRDIENHETILSGDIGLPEETIDNSYHVVVTRGTVVMDGFKIRDGKASCSTYGSTPGVSSFKRDDHGGGIYIESQNSYFINCTITDNSSWSTGSGIYSHGINSYSTVTVNLQNSTISNNSVQQVAIITGGMFILTINADGAGISTYYYPTKLNINNCQFYNNVAIGNGASLKIMGPSTANIENSCFYNSNTSVNHIYLQDGGSIKMNNSTLFGTIQAFNNSGAEIINSTIIGDFIATTCTVKNTCQMKNIYVFDNTIITDFNSSIAYSDNRDAFSDPSFSAQYCIFGNTLIGTNKNQIISNSISNYSSWLEPLSNNGGLTPTAKLKDLPDNLAKGNGNPLYLGTIDQRGVVRSDKASIGAYQWVKSTGIGTTEFSKSVKVYPNPVANELIIEFAGNTQNTDFEVINSLGQVVSSGVFSEKTAVSTASFFPGVYLVKLKSGNTFEFRKVLKN
jgi:hypothetical protein